MTTAITAAATPARRRRLAPINPPLVTPPDAYYDPFGTRRGRLLGISLDLRSEAPTEIVGRDAERARIDRLLDEARGGVSAALVLRGEPGIGKSTLLRHAGERAADATVVRACGIESEADLPYAGLADVLRPLEDRLDEIPAPQAAALAGALALAPPGRGDRFAVHAGTLSLLAAAASDEPVVALVDDAHWLDAESMQALIFAARRLLAERVAVLFAVRSDEESPLDDAALPELRLDGLDRGDAASILAATGCDVSADVGDRLFAATAGNPLALIEIARSLNDDELRGRLPLQEPLSAGEAVERAFARRADRLPASARAALLLAAAGDGGPLPRGERAALQPAEAAGLVSLVDGRPRFSHPLVRSAVYHGASTAVRRAAHRAHAEAIDGSDPARRARHLAAAADGPDEEVARALEQTAEAARLRGGHEAVARTLVRAAELTIDRERRAQRLLAAARQFRLAGRAEHALGALDELLALTEDPLLRADGVGLSAESALWSGSPLETYELLAREAARVEPLDPARAATLAVDAATAMTITGDATATLAAARRACELAERAGPPHTAIAQFVLGHSRMLAGEAQDTPALLERARGLAAEPAVLAGSSIVVPLAHIFLWNEQYDDSERFLRLVVAAARSASALGVLSFPLAHLAELEFRTGRWAAAYADASESVRLAEETGQHSESAFSLVCLARIEAAQGRADACRARVAAALDLVERFGHDPIALYCAAALGLLELGHGREDEAIVHLERGERLFETCGLRDISAIQWSPDLLEAYVRVGRRDDAERVLALVESRSRATGRTWELAVAARGRGLLAGDDAFEEEFEQALVFHERTPTPFERARTDLCFGERLSRARRRVEARQQLRAALAVFERLGAEPWAERARRELGRAGARVRPRGVPAISELTPQELQVALAVADGASNKEVAAALFLSPKTVEFHLGNAYRKLSVRSRADLARLVAERR